MRSSIPPLAVAALCAGVVLAGGVNVDFNPKADFASLQDLGAFTRIARKAFAACSPTRPCASVSRRRSRSACGKRGSSPQPPDAKPDLYVSYRGDTAQGKDVSSNLGGLSSWDNPLYTSVHFTEQTATLMVDLVDASTNALAWRLYIDEVVRGPNDPPDKLSKALDKGFAKYPPTASEIARKAKAIEKGAK